MDSNIADEVLNELFSALESAETQNGAILQLMKDKGLASEEELAPYLRRAGDASNVRWRAARLRINTLLASAIKRAEEEFAKKIERTIHNDPDPQKPEQQTNTEQARGKKEGLEGRKQVKPGGAGASEAEIQDGRTESISENQSERKIA